jgi:hypothetical protein
MRLIVLSVATLLVGAFFVLYGGLLAWSPDLFLKFHERFVDRGQWNRNAAWRRNLDRLEAKTAGAAFVVFGLFIVYLASANLITALH